MFNLERDIQRELTRLDPNLFLDKLRSPQGFVYWAVRYNIGSGVEPLNVVEWKLQGEVIGHERPLDLSWQIVELVKQQEGDIRDAINQVKANNAAKKELARQEYLEGLEEAAREAHSFGKIRRFYGDFKTIQ